MFIFFTICFAVHLDESLNQSETQGWVESFI